MWVDDPLRGDYFEYPAILRGLHSPSISGTNSTNISWETYDNGTNITLTVFYGESMAVRSHRHGPIASSTEVRMSVTTTSR